jgi:hypothetical protein
MKLHRIDYIPGAVELGDFDATATTIAVAPGGELGWLPQPALNRTFERYDEFFRQRLENPTWEAYTPYELRVVGTMIRLGQRDRALRELEFFFEGQRPAAWNHWAEVVWREPRAPRFIGDMPHTWIGSDFIRSARSPVRLRARGRSGAGDRRRHSARLGDQSGRGNGQTPADLARHPELPDGDERPRHASGALERRCGRAAGRDRVALAARPAATRR